MATAAEIAERKAQQAAEATARRAGLAAPAETDEIAPDPTEDRDPSEIDASALQRTAEPKPEDAAPKPLVVPRTAADQRREDLVSRIRARRGADEDTDPFAPAVEQQPTEPVADEDAAAEAAAAAAAEAARKAAETTPAPAARRYKVKVLGEERELSEEEVLAEAQKSLAGDRYLDMAKDRLRQADDLLSQTRTRAASGPDGTNRAAQTDGTERPAGTDEDPDNREDPYVKFIESTQFGEPAQAAQQLKELVREEAKRYAASTTTEQLIVNRAQADVAANKKTLEALTKANSDLAEDPDAAAAIQSRVHAGMVQDFVNTGVPAEKIPTRPDDIAYWHQWYRLNHPDRVRPFEDVATAAFTGYRQKYPKPSAAAETAETAPEGKEQQPAVKRAPQIEVVVERNARRAAIPQQPSRTAIPKPEPQQPQANGQDRSATIQRMNAERMAKRMGRAVPVQ